MMELLHQCPTNDLGIRHSVMRSDGYMYEKRCLAVWFNDKSNVTSHQSVFLKNIPEGKLRNTCLNLIGKERQVDYIKANVILDSYMEKLVDYYVEGIED